MDIIYLNNQLYNSRYYRLYSGNGDSVAIEIPFHRVLYTVLISNPTANVTVQYSLSARENVKNNDAIWHDWANGTINTDSGNAFDSPINYIRVLAESGVTYNLEILG